MKRRLYNRLQAVPPPAQQSERHTDPVFLTLKQAAERYQFGEFSPHDPVAGFRKFARRAGLPLCGHGRHLLVETRIADEFMRGHAVRGRKKSA